MKQNTPIGIMLAGFVLVALLATSNLQAQRRSELQAQIDSLRAELGRTQRELASSQSREKASLAKAESYESQVGELKEANATLLENLGSFAEVSNRNTSALNQALGSLQEKESQVRNLTSSISRNDSTIITLLADAKQTLGPEARLKVSNGNLIVSGTLTDLFGSDTGIELADGSGSWLEKIGHLIRAHPELVITVEGLSMTGDLAIASRQATSVMNELRDQYGVAAGRLSARGRDGNFSEGVDILLHPDHRMFYHEVRSQMRN